MALAASGLSALNIRLGAKSVLTETEDWTPSWFAGTAAVRQMPGCVAFAESVDQVASVLKFAGENRIPVVTRGSGTGLSGGSLAVPDCIILCLVRMDKIVELDRANLTMLVEAGVT